MADPVADINALTSQIRQALANNKMYAGPLGIRLAWHASGTFDKSDSSGGSDGATMRFEPESTDGANAGLGIARDVLEPVAAANPDVSRADIWTLAGKVAIEMLGGPKIPFNFGRGDADASKCPANGRLPDAAQGAQHLRDVFYRMGFNDQEIVALSGAHTVGRCHSSRSGFDGAWSNSPTTFNNAYFKHLLELTWIERPWDGPKQFMDKESGNLMMLPTDLCLIQDAEFKKWVEVYAADEAKFFADFADVFGRLISLGCPAHCQPGFAAKDSEADVGAKKFREAAMHGSLEPCKKFKTADNVNSVDRATARTALHRACYWGHEDTVEYLIAEGADANAVDKEGDTPLIDAARFGHDNVIKALLAAGADKSTKNKSGQDAVAVATAAGKASAVALLQ